MSADGSRLGVVDYLCNAFTPDRRDVWDAAIGTTGIKVKIRNDTDGDGFAEPDEMIARMDELGIASVLLPSTDVGRRGRTDAFDFEHVASRWEETEKLARRWPGRFAALAVVDPERGMAAVRETRGRLTESWVAGLHVHTHSWDRRLDHADYYPHYALAAETGVAVVVQAGTSGGLMASECGRPITLDRAALYFADTPFVLSHLGWPWVDEAVALALKFPNVYLGTAAYPPRHWPAVITDFLRGPGRGKVVFGTNFPTVGHRHALHQLAELDLDADVESALLVGAARAVFHRLFDEGGASR